MQEQWEVAPCSRGTESRHIKSHDRIPVSTQYRCESSLCSGASCVEFPIGTEQECGSRVSPTSNAALAARAATTSRPNPMDYDRPNEQLYIFNNSSIPL